MRFMLGVTLALYSDLLHIKAGLFGKASRWVVRH